MRRLFCCAIAALGVWSCKQMEAPPPPEFKFVVTVESDPGIPMAGAVVMRSGKDIGHSDASGKVTLSFKGVEGETFDLYVKCPEDYVSPPRPVSARLARLSDDKVMGESVRCAPSKRRVIVALRADGAPNLPINHLGREIARTDASGAASLSLTGKPGDTLQFTLDTSDKAFESLRPQSPQLSVVIRDQDDIYPLDQPFQKQPVRTVVVGPKRPRAIGPQPLH